MAYKSSEIVEKMSFDAFKEKVLGTVRKEHHMTLVEHWEKRIIFKEFLTSKYYGVQSYHAEVFYVGENSSNAKSPYTLTLHNFLYCEVGDTCSLHHSYSHLHKEQLQAITRLQNLFSRSKGIFFDDILDKFHEPPGGLNKERIGLHI